MTVDEFAAILRHPAITVVKDGFYPSRAPRGYWANIQSKGGFYWYSVSNTREKIPPDFVAAAITAPERTITREGWYKGGGGFEATVESGGHWYMLGHGSYRKS